MKARGSDGSSSRNRNGCETFRYDSSLWQNDALLNADADGAPRDNFGTPGNSKYKAFSNHPVSKVRLCRNSGTGNCYTYNVGQTIRNFKYVMTKCNEGGTRNRRGGERWCRAPNRRAFRDGIRNVMGRRAGRNCDWQLSGFSTKCPDSNRARMGGCVNIPQQGCQTGDNNDADAAIGLGLNGQSSQCRCGFGLTRWARAYSQ